MGAQRTVCGCMHETITVSTVLIIPTPHYDIMNLLSNSFENVRTQQQMILLNVRHVHIQAMIAPSNVSL